MIIIRRDGADRPSEKRGPTFTGEVWAHPVLSAAEGADGVTVGTVFFTPGARTFWHRHEHGQILQVLGGEGLVGTRDDRPHRLRAGDTVWAPPGEEHWHGASPHSFLTHTAISLGTAQWGSEVADADYQD